jgi:hypothetical protein
LSKCHWGLYDLGAIFSANRFCYKYGVAEKQA